MSNFSTFFPSDKKYFLESGRKIPGSKVGRPLIYCGSKVSLGRVGAGTGPISKIDRIARSGLKAFLKFYLNQKP